MDKTKTSTMPKVIIAVLAAAMLSLVGVIIWLSMRVNELKDEVQTYGNQLEGSYQDSLYQTADGLNSVENNLAKLMVTRSKSLSAVYAADICKDASVTAEAAASLPVSYEDTVKLQKFLNQVSDFAANYLRTAAEDGDLTKYNEQIKNLQQTAGKLKNQVTSLTTRLDGNYRISDNIDGDGFFDISGMADTESSMDYPHIIYDGPFSDGIEDRCYKAIEDKPEIGEEEALKIASEKLGLAEGKIVGTTGEDITLYVLSGKVDGQEAYVQLSKKGGLIVEAEIVRPAGGVNYDQQYAHKFAKELCISLGYCDDLQPVWYNQIQSTAYVNLAPVKKDIVYYPDLIQVKVDLSGGKLAGLEALGYCTNYCEREESYVMNEQAVKTLVSPKLTVKSIRLAVIPKGRGEVLCYEVHSETEGLDFFIYLDAKDGKEVEILRVIDEDQGEMVY